MAFEWEKIVLGCAAGAESVTLLLLTLPGLSRLRPVLVSVIRNALKPKLSVVPFCIFLLLDIYWKYEPICGNEHDQKSIMKSQRNLILIACALLLNWLLLAVTRLVVQMELFSQQI